MNRASEFGDREITKRDEETLCRFAAWAVGTPNAVRGSCEIAPKPLSLSHRQIVSHREYARNAVGE